jgi:predicted deacetylase
MSDVNWEELRKLAAMLDKQHMEQPRYILLTPRQALKIGLDPDDPRIAEWDEEEEKVIWKG